MRHIAHIMGWSLPSNMEPARVLLQYASQNAGFWLLMPSLSVYRIYMHIHPFAKTLGLVAQSFTECIRMPRFTRKHLNIEPTGLCVCVFKHWLTYSQFLQEYLLYIYIYLSLQGTRFSQEYCSLASHLTWNSICLQERNSNLPRMDAVQ